MTPSLLTPKNITDGKKLFLGGGRFIKGVVRIADLPAADRPEICFCGRSNVGKSSLINSLMNQQGLARVSKTPGRTREINFFDPPSQTIYVVDLPGYGYATVSKEKKEQWQELLPLYLQGRPNLQRIFLLVDSRRGLSLKDMTFIEMLCRSAVVFQIILTKVDKLSEVARVKLQETIYERLQKKAAFFPHIISTSSFKKVGLDELRGHVARIVQP